MRSSPSPPGKDSTGTLLWARQTESDTGAWAEGLATDADGNSYLTGAIHGSTTFGAGEPGATTLAASIVGDAFVAKVGSTGTLVWARSINATANTYGLGIATDDSGSAYVTGFFGGSVLFGAGEATEQAFSSLGSSDIFVAKYETNGGFEWAKRAGGATAGLLDEAGNGIALDGFANVHVAGFFTLVATFGEGEPGETSLKADGTDAFVARYMNDDVLPPNSLDLDIAQFRTTSRVSVAKGGSVDLTLVVRKERRYRRHRQRHGDGRPERRRRLYPDVRRHRRAGRRAHDLPPAHVHPDRHGRHHVDGDADRPGSRRR